MAVRVTNQDSFAKALHDGHIGGHKIDMLATQLPGECFNVGRDQRGLPVDKIVRFRIVLASATVVWREVFRNSIPGPDIARMAVIRRCAPKI